MTNTARTIVPALLLEKQRELKIEPIELAVLIQLMSFWWKADALPWPSKKRLGERLGMDPSNVRRHVTRLCEKGIIEPTFVDSPLYKDQGVNFFASRVELGPNGVEKILPVGDVPAYEQKLLEAALVDLKKNIQKGVDFVKSNP